MTSEERREGRYLRRRQKRQEKRIAVLEQHSFEKVADLDNLYKAMIRSRKGVWWKASVQRYDMNYMRNILKAKKALLAGEDVRRGFYKFYITERGKKRDIQSVHFSERVVQKALCANALTPMLTRSLIYDNGASIENKGISFSIKRMRTHLTEFYKKHGTDGYIVLIDFSNYFGNMNHEVIFKMGRAVLGEDERLFQLLRLFVAAFESGLGLGSEICQILAVAYINTINHYIKEHMKVAQYSHYMDDSYFMFRTKQEAHNAVETLLAKYRELGVVVKPEKVKITKLSQGFTFLKVKFSVTPTGRIVMRPNRKSITRQRRKLRKFKKLYDKGDMTLEEVRRGYVSWRGYISQFDSYRSIQSMNKLFNELFREEI